MEGLHCVTTQSSVSAAIPLCQTKCLCVCLCVSLCNCQYLYVMCNFKTDSRAMWKKAYITLQRSPANTPTFHTNMPHTRRDVAIFHNYFLSCTYGDKRNMLASTKNCKLGKISLLISWAISQFKSVGKRAQLIQDAFLCGIKGTASHVLLHPLTVNIQYFFIK